LTSLIVELAQQQPPDPVAALLGYLSSKYAKPAEAPTRPGRLEQPLSEACPLAARHEPLGIPPQPTAQLPQDALREAAHDAQLQTPLGDRGAAVPASTSPQADSQLRPGAVSPDPADSEECDEERAMPEADPLRVLLQERLPSPRGQRVVAPVTEPGLSARRCWAGGFNRALLEGWVKQPSPCCAAASVAGAFNALWELGASSEGRCTVRECADLMAEHCDGLRAQRQQRVERLLGVAEGALGEFLLKLDQHLEASGLQWTARNGPKAVTKQVAMAAVREVLNAAVPRRDSDQEGILEAQTMKDEMAVRGASLPQTVFQALREVLGVIPEGDGSTDGAQEDDNCVQEEQSRGVVISTGTDWKKELQELLTKRKGVMRLRAEKPNTGEIGSWGIKQAAESLALARSTEPIHVTCLMGRKHCMKGVAWTVAKADAENAINHQWAALKAAFGKPHTALIFHLTNHYALIFAWREWLEDSSGQEPRRLRRQVLTARRGQRPSAWLEFDEVRSIMIGWSGYHILQVERLVAQGPDSP